MEYVFIAIAAFIIAIFIGYGGVRAQTVPDKPKVSDVTTAETKTLKRADIKQRLETLAKSKPPEFRQESAMCYDTTISPTTIEYICPKCGEKTLYETDNGEEGSDNRKKIYSLRFCNYFAESIKKLDIEIDESQFCKKCSPDIKSPQLNMIIKYKGEKEHRVNNISAEDMKIIYEFVSGLIVHRIDSGERTTDVFPLKNYLEHLSELLGVEIEIPEKNEK
jgi:hypothetical protein